MIMVLIQVLNSYYAWHVEECKMPDGSTFPGCVFIAVLAPQFVANWVQIAFVARITSDHRGRYKPEFLIHRWSRRYAAVICVASLGQMSDIVYYCLATDG